MAEQAAEHHISSAVVSVPPGQADPVARAIAAMPDTEVHHVAAGKIVIVMEGPSANALGERLAQIALMDHVLSANMVYEVVDREAQGGETEPGESQAGSQAGSQGGEP